MSYSNNRSRRTYDDEDGDQDGDQDDDQSSSSEDSTDCESGTSNDDSDGNSDEQDGSDSSGSSDSSDESSDDGTEDDEDDEEDGDAEPIFYRGAGPSLDPIDPRDHIFNYIAELPRRPRVDLRTSKFYPKKVYDQGAMSSCTAHAVAGAFQFDVAKQGLPHFEPSRLFIWYNSRAKSDDPNAVNKNIGSHLRIAIKSLDLRAHGVCAENDWSYEVSKANKKTHVFVHGAKASKRPTIVARQDAHQHTAPAYESFPPENGRLKKLKQCLSTGYPFVFGMNTYGLLHGSKVRTSGKGLSS